MISEKVKRYIKRKILKVLLRGGRLHCPCCNKKYDTFLPFGSAINLRVNAMCPGCLSLERHRLLILFLKQETPFFSEKLRLLHIAPEHLFYKQFSALKNIKYVPGDLFPDKYPSETVKVDVTNIDFAKESFDVVFCNHVLEHVPNDQQAMSEIYRVLKSNGWAILQVPMDKNLQKTYEDASITSKEERLKAFGQIDHVRVYGLDYMDRLRKVGFKVEEIPFYEKFSKQDRIRMGISTDEDIILCKK